MQTVFIGAAKGHPARNLHWLRALLATEGFDLARVNRQKFLIRTPLEARVHELRRAAVDQAYQQTLFGEGSAYTFDFSSQGYAPSRDDDGGFGVFDFRKHYYGRIGDFDSKEEFDCACKLDAWAQAGRMQFWVRNLVRKQGCSFFLQKADGRFYPDFLCKFDDGAGPAVAGHRSAALTRVSARGVFKGLGTLVAPDSADSSRKVIA